MTNINIALVVVLLVGCGTSPAVEVDAGASDAGGMADVPDTSVEPQDSGMPDSGTDAGVISDAGFDGGRDAEVPDSGSELDAGSDAGSDAGVEVDAGSDAGTDAGVGPGMPVAIGASGNGTCLLTDSNEVWCWGNRQRTPQYVADAVELQGTCGIASDGHVFCWGDTGVVDHAGTDASVVGVLTYASRPSGEVHGLGLGAAPWAPAVAIDSMPAQFCAIHIDGGLTCWDWELGPSRFTNFWTAVSGSASYDVVDVARRGAFSTDDIVVCYAWTGSMPGPGGGAGPGIYCATERGTTGSSLFHGGTEVETAGGRTCAVVPTPWFDTEFHDTGVYCTADRPASLTDTGYWPLNPLPSSDAVGDYTNIVGTNLAVGSNHACIMQGGTILCWGNNSFGQLGDGGTTSSSVPTPVTW